MVVSERTRGLGQQGARRRRLGTVIWPAGAGGARRSRDVRLLCWNTLRPVRENGDA